MPPPVRCSIGSRRVGCFHQCIWGVVGRAHPTHFPNCPRPMSRSPSQKRHRRRAPIEVFRAANDGKGGEIRQGCQARSTDLFHRSVVKAPAAMPIGIATADTPVRQRADYSFASLTTRNPIPPKRSHCDKPADAATSVPASCIRTWPTCQAKKPKNAEMPTAHNATSRQRRFQPAERQATPQYGNVNSRKNSAAIPRHHRQRTPPDPPPLPLSLSPPSHCQPRRSAPHLARSESRSLPTVPEPDMPRRRSTSKQLLEAKTSSPPRNRRHSSATERQRPGTERSLTSQRAPPESRLAPAVGKKPGISRQPPVERVRGLRKT